MTKWGYMKYLLLSICIFCSNVLFSQKVTLAKFEHSMVKVEPRGRILADHDEKGGFYYLIKVGERYHLKSNEGYDFELPIEFKGNEIMYKYGQDITVYKDILYMLSMDYSRGLIAIFDLNKKAAIESFVSDEKYDHIEKVNDSILFLSRAYNGHPKTYKKKSKIFKVNLNSFEQDSIDLGLKGIYLTHFNKDNAVDISNQSPYIIASDLDQPHLYLYDHMLKLLDTLVLEPKDWSYTYKDSLEQFRFERKSKDLSGGDAMNRYRPAFIGGMSKISTVNLIDSNTILVQYYLGKFDKDKGSHSYMLVDIVDNKLVARNKEWRNRYKPREDIIYLEDNVLREAINGKLVYFSEFDYSRYDDFDNRDDFYNHNESFIIDEFEPKHYVEIEIE